MGRIPSVCLTLYARFLFCLYKNSATTRQTTVNITMPATMPPAIAPGLELSSGLDLSLVSLPGPYKKFTKVITCMYNCIKFTNNVMNVMN